MYPHRNLRQIRELELFLFGGVPEVPEPIFERDSNDLFERRTTRQAIGTSLRPAMASEPEEQDGVVRVDLTTGEVTFIPAVATPGTST